MKLDMINPMSNETPKTGRPSKFSTERSAKALKALRQHGTLTIAAAQAGVSRGTFHRWMRQNKAFRRAIKKALAVWERRMLARIDAAAADPKHWQSAAWRLERRFPERYARQSRIPSEAVDAEISRLLAIIHQQQSAPEIRYDSRGLALPLDFGGPANN